MRRDHADEYQRRKLLRLWRAQFGGWCPGTEWCETPGMPHFTEDLTADHVVPRVFGGDASLGLRVMCREANSRRGAGV